MQTGLARIAILIVDKMDFKTKSVKGDRHLVLDGLGV